MATYSSLQLILFFSATCLFHAAALPSSSRLVEPTNDNAMEEVGTAPETIDFGNQEEDRGEVELHIPVSTDLYPEYHHTASSSSDSSRVKRAALPGRYRHKSRRQPNLSGDVVFSARRAFRLFFDFDYASLSNAEILSAHVILYHTRPRHVPRRNRKYRSVQPEADVTDGMSSSRQRRDLDDVVGKSVQDKLARVIMHKTIDYGTDVGSTETMDMKMVDSRTRGWLAFDITPAVQDWIGDSSSNQGLELWVVSSRAGRRAARTALRMKFVKPNSQRAAFRPELVVKLKPAAGAAGKTAH